MVEFTSPEAIQLKAKFATVFGTILDLKSGD
jgi:hypothetical protein